VSAHCSGHSNTNICVYKKDEKGTDTVVCATDENDGGGLCFAYMPYSTLTAQRAYVSITLGREGGARESSDNRFGLPYRSPTRTARLDTPSRLSARPIPRRVRVALPRASFLRGKEDDDKGKVRCSVPHTRSVLHGLPRRVSLVVTRIVAGTTKEIIFTFHVGNSRGETWCVTRPR